MVKSAKLLNNIKLEMTTAESRASNFHLNDAVKKEFKIECARNGQSMSEVLETLMLSYVIQACELREKIEADKD